MELGVHAVLYKELVAKDTVNTVKELAYSGAQGIEVGARFFDSDTKELLLANLKENKLDLFGLHTSCKLTNFIDNFALNLDSLKNAASIAKEINARNVIMTGLIDNENFDKINLGDDRLLDPESVKTIAIKIEESIKIIKDTYSIDVLYHNHNWEFKNERLIYNSLLEYAPSLKFAFDIGWAISQKVDFFAMIKKYPQRFNYLHLRDCSLESLKTVKEFKAVQALYLNIGDGDVDFKALLSYMKNKEDSILVVEYETGIVNKDRYKNAIDYLKVVLNEIN